MEAAIVKRLDALEQAKDALQAGNSTLQADNSTLQRHYEGVCSLITTRDAEFRTLQQRVDTFTKGLDARNEDLKAILARAEVGSYSQLVADVDRFHATHFQR
jgi:Flp pilus assembly protein TadG